MTAVNAEEVVSQVTSIVSNLDESDEQSKANLDLIVNVYDNIVGNLIETNNFSVSTNVRQLSQFTACHQSNFCSYRIHVCTVLIYNYVYVYLL